MIRALLVFSVGTLAIACCLPTEPDPIHVCDREKRAVWHSLGNESEPPASLMAVSEWNIDRQTYYFNVMAADPGVCRVLRA